MINYVFACELEPGDKILSGQEFRVGHSSNPEPLPVRLQADVTVERVTDYDGVDVIVHLRSSSSHLRMGRGRVVRCA